MARKLSDIRPCDNCAGPVGLIFYIIRFSLVVVNRRAVEEFAGMHQFFGGRASTALVENFSPSAADAIKIPLDDPEFKELVTELFICGKCYLEPLDLPQLAERRNVQSGSNQHG